MRTIERLNGRATRSSASEPALGAAARRARASGPTAPDGQPLSPRGDHGSQGHALRRRSQGHRPLLAGRAGGRREDDVPAPARFRWIPKTGELVEGDVAAQTERVMQNLKAVLAAAGLDFRHVVRCTIFLTDLADFAKVNEVYGRVLPRRAARARHRAGGRAAPRCPGGDRRHRRKLAASPRAPRRSRRQRAGRRNVRGRRRRAWVPPSRSCCWPRSSFRDSASRRPPGSIDTSG